MDTLYLLTFSTKQSYTKDCGDGYTALIFNTIQSLNRLQNAINKKVKVGNCKQGYNSAWLQQFKPRAI